MNKILYRICKVLNWIMPFFILILGDKIYIGYWLYVLIGYFAFSVFWFFWSSTRSRLTYQSFFFAGYIIGLYNAFTKNDTVFENMLDFSSEEIHISAKIFMVFISAVAFASKIITMIAETAEYNAGYKSRHNNKLDDKIYSATYEYEHARTSEEKRKAEMRLERAKLDKE